MSLVENLCADIFLWKRAIDKKVLTKRMLGTLLRRAPDPVVRRKIMKQIATLIILVVLVALIQPAMADTILLKPVLTISGHYKVADGRVDDRTFPVKFELFSDGKFKGTYESWMEERDTDGSADLQFYDINISGSWTVEDSTILLVIKKEQSSWSSFPNLKFKAINGLNINISKDKYPNKSDAGDGK
jgi:hypothetical protein